MLLLMTWRMLWHVTWNGISCICQVVFDDMLNTLSCHVRLFFFLLHVMSWCPMTCKVIVRCQRVFFVMRDGMSCYVESHATLCKTKSCHDVRWGWCVINHFMWNFRHLFLKNLHMCCVTYHVVQNFRFLWWLCLVRCDVWWLSCWTVLYAFKSDSLMKILC